jgi:predicted ATPase
MSIIDDIKAISQMKGNGIFRHYIEHIRYPKFRNLEPNTQIDFAFPLTFLVGKNGGGKSSTLQSLFGCPLNKSLGSYWFSTALDPINDLKKNRNCFIYGYDIDGVTKEVLKQRAPRKGNLDYWEPSKPVKKYGMDTSARISPIEKEVAYIDFRSELSAYDKFMYFQPFNNTKTIKTKQDFVRRHSLKLKKAFEEKNVVDFYNKQMNKVAVTISQEEIEAVSFILGKNYSNIEILEHRFFKEWGFSVRFKNNELQYSEAFAGSGESAVIGLVNRIHNCVNETLVLLDEPETSLHPGAQTRLIGYLIKKIKTKKLQVVVSTHSPYFLNNMPANSIKVFTVNSNGTFHIENDRKPKEAFVELEIEETVDKNQIIVEDSLAKSILECCLKKLGNNIFDTFEIKYLSGGASSVKQRLSTIIEFDNKPYVIFDGDQKKIPEHIDLDSLPNNQIGTYQKLNALLKTQTESEIHFFVDGNNEAGGNDDQKIEFIQNYFRYYKEYVHYLPCNIPEEIIWDDDYALNRITDLNGQQEDGVLNDIKVGNHKDWFINLCKKVYGDIKNLNALHHEFIINWHRKGDDNLDSIIKILNTIRE